MKVIDREIEIAELLNTAGMTKVDPVELIKEERQIMLTPYEYIVYRYMCKYWSKTRPKTLQNRF